MKYYAFTYLADKDTPTGDPHKKTGRRSIAGRLSVFRDKGRRNQFVADYPESRIAVKWRNVRDYFLGISEEKFNQMIKEVSVDCSGKLKYLREDKCLSILQVRQRDAVIMSNARKMIRSSETTTNRMLYRDLFAVGFTTAGMRCTKLGLNIDGVETKLSQMLEFIENNKGG